MSSVSDELCLRRALSPTSSVSNELLSLMWKILEDSMNFFFSLTQVRTSHGIVLFMDQHVGCTKLPITPALSSMAWLVSYPDPTQLTQGEWKGSGVTSQNSWAISRSLERPIKLQSSVYWNNAEVGTNTSIICSKCIVKFVIQPICNSTLTITRLQDFRKPKNSGLWHQTLSSWEGWVWAPD